MFNFTLSSFFGVSCTGKLFVTQKTKLFVILYLLFSVNSHGASTAYTSPYHKLGLNVESERNKSFITRDLSNVTIFQLIFPKKSDETRTNIFEWQCRRRMETTRNKLLLVSDCNLWMKHSKITTDSTHRLLSQVFILKYFLLSLWAWKYGINLSCPRDDKRAPLLSSSSLRPHPSHQLLINVTWYFKQPLPTNFCRRERLLVMFLFL